LGYINQDFFERRAATLGAFEGELNFFSHAFCLTASSSSPICFLGKAAIRHWGLKHRFPL
jgi:hypothetical protein